MKAPTLTEVVQYFKSLDASTDLAKAYFERYQTNGWTVTGLPSADTNWQPTRRPMKRWKASAKAFIERNDTMTKNRLYRRS